MKRHLAAGAAALLCGALLSASPSVPKAGAASEPPPHIKLLPAGDTAPDFTGVDIDGKPFTFSEEYARGPVLLVFWSIF